jgi:hypothetical protein
VVLFASEPLDPARLEAAYRAIAARVLGGARTTQDLGSSARPRGLSRTRVLSGTFKWPDGRSSSVVGEVQTIAGPEGGLIAGFLVRQGGPESDAPMAGADWIAAFAESSQDGATSRPVASPPVTPAPVEPKPVRPQLAPSSTAITRAPPPAGLPAVTGGRRQVLPAAAPEDWRKAAWAGGDPVYVQIDGGGIAITYPAGARHGAAGAVTTSTAVRLGDLAAGAQTRVVFQFDPAATTGALFGLCTGRHDNCLTSEGYGLLWQPAADGAPASLRRLSGDGRHRDIPITASSPGRVEIAISGEGFIVSGDGIAPFRDTWELLQPFLALEIAVQALPHKEGAAAAVKLARVEIDDRPAPPKEAAPAPGVAPLPVRTLFAGTPDPAWVPFPTPGGEAAFARFADGRFIADVPAGRGWGWTGLASATAVADVPWGAARAPRRLSIKVDPQTTTGFGVGLSLDPPHAGLRLQARLLVSWQARAGGGSRLTVMACARDRAQFVMDLPPGWDGTLDVRLMPRAFEVGAGGGWRIATYATCIDTGWKFFAAVFAAAPVENQPAHLVLERIAIDRVSPAGMTAAERFQLLDDDAFDAKDFLKVLGQALKEGKR